MELRPLPRSRPLQKDWSVRQLVGIGAARREMRCQKAGDLAYALERASLVIPSDERLFHPAADLIPLRLSDPRIDAAVGNDFYPAID